MLVRRDLHCIIRNAGTGWNILIDSDHQPIGVTSLTQMSDRLRLFYDFTAVKVHSFHVTEDETYAALDPHKAGASVGFSYADIYIGRTGVAGKLNPSTVANANGNLFVSGFFTVDTDAQNWTLVKPSAQYSPRDSCRVFHHNGEVFLSNGYQHGGVCLHDLWKSPDGINWQLVNAATPYTGWCPVVSFSGEIVAIGEKVMKSSDGGVTFTTVLETPPFVITQDTKWTWIASVWNGKLILIGGNKLWWTENLTTWQSVTLPFYRVNCALWNLNGRIYLAGGNNNEAASPPEIGYPAKTSFNDVWAADDLIAGTWTRVCASAPWAKRMWPGFCVHNDELVLAGGYDNTTGATNFDDTWVSPDGVNWRQLTGDRFTKRHYPSLVSHQGKVILNNGNRSPNQSPGVINDVWMLQ